MGQRIATVVRFRARPHLIVVTASLLYLFVVQAAAGTAAGSRRSGVLGARGGAEEVRVGLLPLLGSSSLRGAKNRMGKEKEGKKMKKDSKKAQKLEDAVEKRRKEEEEEEGVECKGKEKEMEEEAGAERRKHKEKKKEKKKGKKEKKEKAEDSDGEGETVGTPLSRKAKRKERKEKRRRESEGLGEDEEEQERRSKKKRSREKDVEERGVKEEEGEEEEAGDEVEDANKDRGAKKRKKKNKESREEEQQGEEAHKTKKNKAAQQEPAAPTPLVVHPFKTEEADHAETPLLAYQHIEPALVYLAKKLGKTKETLKIYDPYFCTGAIVRNMAQIGFTSIHNRCEDFYQVIKEGRVPEHNVVVTNPPYSSNHVMKILR